ncbi:MULTISPECIES: helix-turn-helix domain-containing protein [Cryobacterium]|uniref:Cupin domain-containing protein n=2 Tax=Bacteria TaxID=2 RepID=A0ABY2IJ17_9MICO|nr:MULTISPECIES: XRE family transcriptional regulator [Cryobacterium]MDY7529358.1 XRE family transcriptional regulator [Cryobacterium sp. 10C2]MEB0202871.1 XRE family transcriptional regulator [Cryobacterium sp. 5I3]MEB0288109.1 XRE family transcriptional regulator [Cryobacterium sp. 10S3]MEB0290200.1 XRE family transcriptional regulator [Cryobacterium sp. 10C2]MEB0304691.1 XRE family transcriptional regulator [Cryobacterium sp. 10I1]
MARQIPIGARLRAARQAKNLTLEAVSTAAGVTSGFLSRMERDQVSPSVSSLVAICDVVGLRVGELFEAPATQIVRAGEGAPINFGGQGAEEFLLTPGVQTHMQVIHSRIQPGGSAGPDLYELESEAEFVLVLAGSLELVIGEDVFLLATGDAMTFRGRDPHRWRNPSPADACEVIWMLAPAP